MKRALSILCLLAGLAASAQTNVYLFPQTNQPLPYLQWQASTNQNVVGYNVYEGGAPYQFTNVLFVGNVTNWIPTNLVQGNIYSFSVTAVFTNNALRWESDFSNVATTSIPVIPAGVKLQIIFQMILHQVP